MEFSWQRLRMIAVTGLVLIGCGSTIAVGRPHAVSDPILGADWQCSRTVFVVTCSHAVR
jgi:hypothetical protein